MIGRSHVGDEVQCTVTEPSSSSAAAPFDRACLPARKVGSVADDGVEEDAGEVVPNRQIGIEADLLRERTAALVRARGRSIVRK